MRQKSVPEKEPATQVVKNIRRARGGTFRPKTRSASYWKACAARTVLSRTSITGGRKTFSRPERSDGWRYGPGRDIGRG